MTKTATARRRGLAPSIAFLVLGPAGLVAMTPAWAGEPQGFNGYIAVGGAVAPRYEGAKNDYRALPFAAGKLSYDGFYIEALGSTLRANIIPLFGSPREPGFNIEMGPAVSYRLGRSHAKNSEVAAMHDIDGTIAVGGFVKLAAHGLLQKTDQLAVGVQGLTGVGNKDTGMTVSFGPSYNFPPFQRTRLGFKVIATYANDKYNQTYFGVDAADALRSGLPIYTPKAGIKDVSFSTNLSYQLSRRWSIMGSVGVERLTGDAANSPIVKDAGSATQGFASLGVSYRF